MRILARAFTSLEVVLVLTLLAAAGVVALPHSFPHLFKPKDHTDQLAQAQASLKAEQAKEAQLQAQLKTAQASKSTAQDGQVRYAQEMVSGADASLSRAPAAARTPEVQLASAFIGRANVGLAAAIGALPKDDQASVLKIVDGALSQVEAERDQAQAALAAKDKELAVATQAKAAALQQVVQLQGQVQDEAQTVKKVQGLVDQKSTEVLTWVKKKDAADAANAGLSGLVQFFRRLLIGGLLLWFVLGVLAPVLLRGLPELGTTQKALHWLSQALVAPGHALVAWLNGVSATPKTRVPTPVPFPVTKS